MYRVSGGIDPLDVNVGIRWRSASSHGSSYPTEITRCIDWIWHWLGPSVGLHDCLCRNSNPGSCQPVVFKLLISVEPLWLNVTKREYSRNPSKVKVCCVVAKTTRNFLQVLRNRRRASDCIQIYTASTEQNSRLPEHCCEYFQSQFGHYCPL